MQAPFHISMSALGVQVGHDLQRAGAGHHPVGACLHGGAGVGVDDDLAVRVGVAEGREVVGRAAQVQRAGRVQVGHQHALLGAQDLGGLAHEAHAGHDQRLRRVVTAEAGHLQRVRDDAAGGQRQVLQRAVDVVVGDEDGVVLLEQRRGALGHRVALGGRQWRGCLGPGMGRGAGAGGVLLGVVKEDLGHLGICPNGSTVAAVRGHKCRAEPAAPPGRSAQSRVKPAFMAGGSRRAR
jgi:hypothetical protein